MTVATKIMMGSGAVGIPDAIDVAQSIICINTTSSKLVKQNTSAGNKKTFTISAWVKRAGLGKYNAIFGGGAGTGTSEGGIDGGLIIKPDDTWGLSIQGNVYNAYATQKLRDTAAWYHLVAVLDTTQAVEANRFKLYKNGVEVEAYTEENTGFPAQNVETAQINKDDAYHQISGLSGYDATDYFVDGCLTELNFIDGLALTPSAFGKTNPDTGQWVAIEYAGTYGTNGCYMKFASGAIGTDSSGESNNYTVSNLANADVSPDTPTNNFPVLQKGGLGPVTLSKNNTVITGTSLQQDGVNVYNTGGTSAYASMAMDASGSTGYYWEIRADRAVREDVYIYGIQEIGSQQTGSTGPCFCFGGEHNQKVYVQRNRTVSTNGTTLYNATNANNVGTHETGAILGLAFKNNKLWLRMNGTWFGDPANNTPSTHSVGLPIITSLPDALYVPVIVSFGGMSTFGDTIVSANFGNNGTFGGTITAGGQSDANGDGNFKYSVPSGFLCLCNNNIPDPAIALPSANFDTVLYTGNGSTQSISGVGHQPDFVWIKNRSAADNHKLTDAVRGVTKELESNTGDAEVTNADGLTAFASDGFALGDDDEYNTNNEAYVSWNWKANGAGSNDTSGDIDATVSANQTTGFSIVNYVPNGTASATVPHGLGVAPEMVFYKRYNSSSTWFCWTTVIDGSDDYLELSTTAAKSNVSQAGSTSFTSSFIRATNYGASGSPEVVAYCFVSKPGFSKVGIYTGNGNADGPHINTGFKPALVIRKRTDSTGDWFLYDAKINPMNSTATGTGLANIVLWGNTTSADEPNGDAGYGLDILSNGFKTTSTIAPLNANTGTFLYMAFAESPFKTTNAR